MADAPSPIPILPGDTDDESRRSHTRKRLRLLTSAWADDLDTHRKRHFDGVRNRHMGPSDLSTNFLMAIVSELAKLYELPTDVQHDDDVSAFLEQIIKSGWWQLAQLHQRHVLGLNESLVRPHWSAHLQAYTHRLVSPSDVYAQSNPDTPDVPSLIVEAREREFGGRPQWTWDYANAKTREFRILLPGKQMEISTSEDITAEVMDDATIDWTGDRYPFVGQDGVAEVPYIVYHSERTGWLFDAYRGLELIDGTLTSAVMWTFWQHVVRDASWPQRYVVGAKLRGTDVRGSDTSASRSVDTDPASILQFRADGEGTATVGQWNPAADPKLLGEALLSWDQRLAVFYHLGSDDFQRSGAAESGYAIALKRQSVREACAHYAPQFSRSDSQLLRLCAIMQNQAEGTSIPEDGYRVSYPSLPRSIEERKAESDEIDAKIGRGTASDVDAYILEHPGTSRDAALAKLMEIDREQMVRLVNKQQLQQQAGILIPMTTRLGAVE